MIRSRHLLKEVLTLREIVVEDGIVMWGRPAVRRLRSSASLTIFAGLLYSAIHFTSWALQKSVRWVDMVGRQHDLPDLRIRVRTVRMLHRLLSLTSKHRKNRATITTRVFRSLHSSSHFHGCLSKTSASMVLEIGSRSLVFWVLVASDPTYGCLAFSRCTGKKVTKSSIMILNSNIGFEEGVDRGAPGSF